MPVFILNVKIYKFFSDGFTDQSPDPLRRPGRICAPVQNHCLDRSLNDCDPIAVCENNPNGGYACRCPVNSIDESPDKRRMGRKCTALINECGNPLLNNCSRFADCTDKQTGYSCKCKEFIKIIQSSFAITEKLL